MATYKGIEPLKFREMLPALALWTGIVVVIISAGVFWMSEVRQSDMDVREAVAERARIERELREMGMPTPSPTPQPLPVPPEQPETTDDVRIADIASIIEALEAIRAATGVYPLRELTEDGLLQPMSAVTSPCLALTSGGYLETCPLDPLSPERAYRYASDSETYTLEALLDADDYPCDPTPEGCRYRVVDGLVVSGETTSRMFLFASRSY